MEKYASIEITDEIVSKFKPTRLCIKKLTDVYYFCKSTKLDIIKYTGSGSKWKSLIKKYGKENIKTMWISDWYYNPQEIHDVALHFSRENDIIDSKIWANIVPEWGLDCYTRLGAKESTLTRQRKSIARKGSKNPMFGLRGELSPHYGTPHTETTKKKQSVGVKKYAENRPRSHNENISIALKGNKKLSDLNKGDKNPAFKGYYIAPTGEKFDSSRNAAKFAGGVDKKTLISWAKNNTHGWSYEPKNFTHTDIGINKQLYDKQVEN